MYRVVISPSANADLLNILSYVAYELENPQEAAKLADEVESCYVDLEEFPAAHELCRDHVLRRIGYRRYPVGDYLVIYRIVEDAHEVRIVHLFHVSQNYISELRDEI